MKHLHNKLTVFIYSVIMALAFSGCGSEGTPSNTILVGDTGSFSAYAPAFAFSHHKETLYASIPSDGSYTIHWTQISGTHVKFYENGLSTATFKVPDINGSDTLGFEVTITDEYNQTQSRTVYTDIFSDMLIVDAGQSQEVNANAIVSLHGYANMNDGHTSLDVRWTQVDGNVSVDLQDADSFNPTFLSPNVQDETLLTFNMHVGSEHFTAEDNVTVRVLPTGVPQILTVNPIVTYTGTNVITQPAVVPQTDTHNQTHTWTQISGPAVTLQNTDSLQVTCAVPSAIDENNVSIVLEQTVTSTPVNGGTPVQQTIQHVIHVIAPQLPLSLLVTPPQTLYEGELGSLHVSVSGGKAPYTIKWSQIQGTAVTIDATDPNNPTFTAPAVTADEVIELKVEVKDDDGNTVSQRVPVTIRAVPTTIPQIVPNPILTYTGTTVTTQPAVITQTDTNTLTYNWTQISGPAVTLQNTDSLQVTCAVPSAIDESNVSIVLEQTVTSTPVNGGTPVQQTIQHVIQVIAPQPQLAILVTPPHTLYEGGQGALHMSVSGGDGNYTINWSQTHGTVVTLDATDPNNPTFTAPVVTADEVIELKVEVTDGSGNTAFELIPVTIKNASLKVKANDQALIKTDHEHTFTFHASVDAVQSGVPPYNWSWTQKAGASAVITNGDTDNPTVTIPTPEGVYRFEVEVIDSMANVATASAVVVQSIDFAVDAGTDIIAKEDANVSLHASITNSPTIKSIKWTKKAVTSFDVGDVNMTDTDTLNPKLTFNQGYHNPQTVELNVTVEDILLQKRSDTVLVTFEPILPTVSVTGDSSVQEGISVQATCNTSGGFAPLTYAWTLSDDSLFSSVSGTDTDTLTYTVDSAASSPVAITCSVTDTYGRTVSSTQPVSVTPAPVPVLPLHVDISGPNDVDENAIAPLTAVVTGGTAPYTYAWSSMFNYGTLSDTTAANPTYRPNPLPNGGSTSRAVVLNLTVTDANGATAVAGIKMISIRFMYLNASIIAPQTVNEGDTFNLLGEARNGYSNTYTYHWALPNNVTATTQSVTIDTNASSWESGQTVLNFVSKSRYREDKPWCIRI